MNPIATSHDITLYHATNLNCSKDIINEGAIKGRKCYAIMLSEVNGSGFPDLTALFGANSKFTLTNKIYLANSPVLASVGSDHGSDVVFEVNIPYALVKEHLMGPGTYETVEGVEQIPLGRATKILSSRPDETKKALSHAGLDILVERWLSPDI
ncbi:MAG: hypothetical protein AABX34_01170 [Nanoarchaeota archaeon]